MFMINKTSFLKSTDSLPQGFTLIEVVLGAALLSFIGLCVYGTFRVGMDLSLRMEARRNIFRPMGMSMDRIMRELENAVPYDFSGSYPERVAFKGQHHSLQFMARFPDGLRVIHYYLAPLEQAEISQTLLGQHYKRNETVTQVQQTREAKMALMREEMSLADFVSKDESVASQKDIVLSGLTQEDWGFFYGQRSGSWQEEWTGSDLPAAIKINAAVAVDNVNGVNKVSTTRSVLFPTRLILGRG